MPSLQTNCPLCLDVGGELILEQAEFRVVFATDTPLYPVFCRVIWKKHVTEMTDLSPQERNLLMQTVWDIETVLRQHLNPKKINIASFGNVVPHVHWHIIPRFEIDPHYPSPIWEQQQRECSSIYLAKLSQAKERLKESLLKKLIQTHT